MKNKPESGILDSIVDRVGANRVLVNVPLVFVPGVEVEILSEDFESRGKCKIKEIGEATKTLKMDHLPKGTRVGDFILLS